MIIIKIIILLQEILKNVLLVFYKLNLKFQLLLNLQTIQNSSNYLNQSIFAKHLFQAVYYNKLEELKIAISRVGCRQCRVIIGDDQGNLETIHV